MKPLLYKTEKIICLRFSSNNTIDNDMIFFELKTIMFVGYSINK